MERISDFVDAIVEDVDGVAMGFDLGGGKRVEERERVGGAGEGKLEQP